MITPPSLTIAPTIGKVGCPTVVMFNAPPPSLFQKGYEPTDLKSPSPGTDFCSDGEPDLSQDLIDKTDWWWRIEAVWTTFCDTPLRQWEHNGVFSDETVSLTIPSGPIYSHWMLVTLTTALNQMQIRQRVIDTGCSPGFVGTCPDHLST